MHLHRSLGVLAMVLGALCLFPASPDTARADGFIVIHHPPIVPPRPRPPRIAYMPLSVKYHRVTVDITNAAAVTKIDQVFHNPNPRQLEGTYIFPLEDDVAVQRFSMYMNGKEVTGEILEKDKARKIYEDYVRKMKDPALLEYVGTRMFKARVFPIPANGDVRIKMDYSQAVPVRGGSATYRYPLNTEKFSSKPLEEVSVVATVTSDVPLSNVFCPSHPVRIDRKGEKKVVVSFEDKDVRPDKDFLLYYQLTEKEFGLSLLTHRAAGEDGFFMARLAPRMPDPDKVIPKDICFVIDVSGSMSGEKIRQAQKSLQFCLSNLNKKDRFCVVPFSTESKPFQDKLVDATPQNVQAARKRVDDLKAIGGTNINEAVLDALKMAPKGSKRPYMVVFMTDGKPTIGVTDVQEILKNVSSANEDEVRIFVLGVGTKVNTRLLDKLADDNHGSRDYVTENEDLEIKLSNFYTALANPVLSDVKLTFQGVTVDDVYPKKLPDLFKGSEIAVYGRYSGSGKATIRLTGQRDESKMLFSFPMDMPSTESAHEFVPRLWARTKIGYLMDQIRLHGANAELKDEVVRLSKKYGIMTELTSWLVLEDEARSGVASATPRSLSEAMRSRSFGRRAARGRVAFKAKDGAESVRASRRLQAMKSAKAPSDHAFAWQGGSSARPGERQAGAAGQEVRSLGYLLRDKQGKRVLKTVGAKTFFRDGERWIDSAYTVAKAKPDVTKIKLYSDEYFRLTEKHPEVAKYLAIGPRVLVVVEGKAYETVE